MLSNIDIAATGMAINSHCRKMDDCVEMVLRRVLQIFEYLINGTQYA